MIVFNELVSALILAVVQGITEWFPVSSSGHLVLFEKILGFSGGLEFEAALHFGTLMAVFVYFGKDIMDILRDFFSFKFDSDDFKLGALVVVASVPAGLVGFFVRDFFESVFSKMEIVALGFGVTGILLLITGFSNVEKGKKIGFWRALGIGVSQVFALIPGISRSGATISSGILFGLKEKEAMKFSFLMAIPVIFGANILTFNEGSLRVEFLWATLVSFMVGLMAIHLVFKYFLNDRKNFKWFGVYCLVLALLVLFWLVL